VDRRLIITADDFGLWPSYDAGIMEAVRAGAVDAVSVMARRMDPLPAELAAWGGAVGLHLEAGPDGSLREKGVEWQLDAFVGLVGRAPDYIDGHHHCHAQPGVAAEVAALADSLDLPVRSVSEQHRALLRAAGVRTADRLIGRIEESQRVIPLELAVLPTGWTEWMVHPGHRDPGSGSSYDAGREEDLVALLALQPVPGVDRADQRRLPGAAAGS